MSQALIPSSAREASLELAIAAWLDAKFQHSESQRTRDAYQLTLQAFRDELQAHSLDLNSEPELVALVAQAWLQRLTSRNAAPSANTVNTRRAILSSFYTFARRRFWRELANPLELVERKSAQAYARAIALSPDEVRTRLFAIPRSSLLDLRDRALIAVTVTTGRRLAEIQALRYEDLLPVSDGVVVTWRRVKGGRVLRDLLEPGVARILSAYTLEYIRVCGPQPRDSHVWRALDHRAYSEPMHPRSIERVCARRMGGISFHALRHSFAYGMVEAGADMPTLMHRLGHKNLATTTAYVQAVHSGQRNPYGAKLASAFGLTTEDEKAPAADTTAAAD